MVEQKVCELLDDLKAKKKPIPSIRQIRSMIGSGSFTTISDAIRQWRYSQLQAIGQAPNITKEDIASLGEVVWQAVEPFVQQNVNRINEQAEARVVIESQEAAKVKALAIDMLAEAELKEKEYQVLQHKLHMKDRECASLTVLHDALQRENAKLQEQLQESRSRNEQLRDRAVAAEAKVNTLNSLIDLLKTGGKKE